MSLFAWPQCALMAEGNISPNPDRREDEGRMWLFVYAAVVTVIAGAGVVWWAVGWMQR